MSANISVDTFESSDHVRDHNDLKELASKLNRASVLISLYGYRSACEKRKNQHHVVGSHALSAINSLSSILRLTDKLSVQVREALLLSRGAYETLLLGAFCSMDNGARANRAMLHAIYKNVRMQTQHATLGKFQISVAKTPRINRKHPRVIEAMKLFGGSSNTRPCFSETRAQMINAIADIDQSAGILFSGVEAMIYDIGSEIVHGSYYAWDTFNAPAGGEAKRLQMHYHTAHYALFLSAAAFCRSINSSLIPSDFFEDLERFALNKLEARAAEESNPGSEADA